MADAAPNDEPKISGAVPLYKQPEPLHRQRHRNLGIKTVERPFEFLREAHFVPALMGEFGIACGHYPIIFIGENKLPVLVMGLRPGENLFIDDKGFFNLDAIVPAFVRRYPFVSAANTDGQPSTVCIDRASDMISDKPDFPFFDENGEPTQIVENAIQFVSAFESDTQITEAFVKRIVELGLLHKKELSINAPPPEGGEPKPVKIAEYFGVDEEKFQALPAETLAELRSNGYLGAIYAHFISLMRWEAIINRSMQRRAQEQGAAPAGQAN